MADTSLPLESSAKAELQKYRAQEHDNWSETVEAVLDMLPDPEQVYQEGCINCGETPPGNTPLTGVNFWMNRLVYEEPGMDVSTVNYFCSPDCVEELQDEADHQFPDEPDKVLIGGRSMIRAEVGACRFIMDGAVQKLSLDIPGAFGGESDSGAYQYEYEGEPVYIYNNGEVVNTAVVDDIIHEDAHTAIILRLGHSVPAINHPDADVRESYEDEYMLNEHVDCPDCGVSISYPLVIGLEACPQCEATLFSEDREIDHHCYECGHGYSFHPSDPPTECVECERPLMRGRGVDIEGVDRTQVVEDGEEVEL